MDDATPLRPQMIYGGHKAMMEVAAAMFSPIARRSTAWPSACRAFSPARRGAADRLCLSQSATSSTLGGLRDNFDELLVFKGRQMALTARAEQLIGPRAVLEQISQTIAVAPEFDPATSERTIRIMGSDHTTEVLPPPALASMARLAPNMRFEIHNMTAARVEAPERGFVDLLVTVDFATRTSILMNFPPTKAVPFTNGRERNPPGPLRARNSYVKRQT